MSMDIDWLSFLADWKGSLTELYKENQDAWKYMGLPNVSHIDFCQPDAVGLEKFRTTWRSHCERSVMEFFEVSNGWPLWLGESQVEISPLSDIRPFRDAAPESFRIAIEYAPKERVITDNDVSLSVYDFETALQISYPFDARDVVMLLQSGETCLFQFDSIRIYSEFSGFMLVQFQRVKAFLEEMIELHRQGWR